MTTLPFRPPCNNCRGRGFTCDLPCLQCNGKGFTDEADRIEIRDRHEEQIAGLRVIAWGFGAFVAWAFVAAVVFVMWLILKD